MSSVSLIGGVSNTDWLNNSTSLETSKTNNASFESLFQSALSMVNETNDLTNSAEEAEMDYALGNSDNPLTLMVAQNKANVSLQYTTAVRSAVLDAYKEIMNLQF